MDTSRYAYSIVFTAAAKWPQSSIIRELVKLVPTSLCYNTDYLLDIKTPEDLIRHIKQLTKNNDPTLDPFRHWLTNTPVSKKTK
jgi:hypothetical protein